MMVEIRPKDKSGPGETSLGSRKVKSRKGQEVHREKQLAERLGMQTQPASGALAAHKGDMKDLVFLFDSKASSSGSILISGKDLTKIVREANGERKIPGLVLTIKEVPSTIPHEWVMIPLEDFATFKAAIENVRSNQSGNGEASD